MEENLQYDFLLRNLVGDGLGCQHCKCLIAIGSNVEGSFSTRDLRLAVRYCKIVFETLSQLVGDSPCTRFPTFNIPFKPSLSYALKLLPHFQPHSKTTAPFLCAKVQKAPHSLFARARFAQIEDRSKIVRI